MRSFEFKIDTEELEVLIDFHKDMIRMAKESGQTEEVERRVERIEWLEQLLKR